MNLSEIRKALKYGENELNIPSDLFAEARNSVKWKEIRDNPFYIKSLELLRNYGEIYINTPINSLPFSKYKVYDTTGSRLEYQSGYYDHRGRLNTLALLSLIYGEARYLEALEDIIWAICDEYTWCLPAHLDGKSHEIIERPIHTASVNFKNNIREHDKVVDLFSAETGFALTEICELLGDKLAPIVVHRARKLVKERVLESYCELNSIFDWETRNNNWAAVCAGSIGMTAVYLIKDSDVLTSIISRVLNTMECFLSGFAEDGACTEGLGYWYYGFGYYVQFSELLRQRTKGALDGFKIPKVKEIALFQQKCYLSSSKVVSFSDSGSSINFHPGILCFLKNLFEEVRIPAIEYRSCFSKVGSWGVNIRNLIWSDPKMQTSIDKKSSCFLPDAMWLISRTDYKGKYCSFAAKGGHNNEPHNHNDIGSFILQLGNEQVLTDIGSGLYTKQYFGPDRYTIFCNGSQGHSVPIIDGLHQQAGEHYYAVVNEQYSTPGKDIFEINMTKAYQVNNLLFLTRRWEFTKETEINLILKDTYKFENKPEGIVERFVSFIKPKLILPGKVEFVSSEGTVTAEYDPDKMTPSFNEEYHMNHSSRVKIYCMDLYIEVNSNEFEVEIKFTVW